MNTKDRNEILAMLRDLKIELRHELWGGADDSLKDRNGIRNTAEIGFVTLAEKGDVDETTATEHISAFEEWAYPKAYAIGNLRRDGDKLYKCLQAHTSQEGWEPHNTPALWAVAGDPTVEFPPWSQPVGAGDAYELGAKVSFNDKHWVSNVGNNVWTPGVYGWDEVQ